MAAIRTKELSAASLMRSRRFSRQGEGARAAVLLLPFVVLLTVAENHPDPVRGGAESRLGSRHSLFSTHGYRIATHYFDFWATFGYIGGVMLVWIPLMMIGVTAMALVVMPPRVCDRRPFRFVYYLSGALPGAANSMLWLFTSIPLSALSTRRCSPWTSTPTAGRTVSLMSTVLVSRDGRPRLTIGAPGGQRIFGTVVQSIMNVIDHGMTVQEAVAAPPL